MIRALSFAAIAIFYFAVTNARPDFSRFNAHDSESYLALAYNLVHGNGYTRSMQPDLYVPHKTWPPGMPALLAPAVAISGDRIDWFAVKATLIIVGLLGILATWHLVRRITSRTELADLAALIVALNPFYWDFSHQAMSEVPTIVWALASLLLADKIFAQRSPGAAIPLAAGVLCGVGMLLRGTLVGVILIPAAYLFGARAMLGSMPRRFAMAGLWAAGFLIPFVLLTLRNRGVQAEGLDGLDQVRMILSKSLESTELKSPVEILVQIADNLLRFGVYRLPEQTLPGLWAGAFDWKGSGWLAISLTAVLLAAWWPRRPRTAYFGLDLVIWPMLALSLMYTEGGSQRYWVPASVLFSVLLLIRLGPSFGAYLASSRRHHATAVAVTLLVLVPNLAVYVYRHEQRPYNPKAPWSQLAALFIEVEGLRLDTQGVLTPNMHAFQLMTGYPAPMAVTRFNPSFDHMVARDDGKGPQPLTGSSPVVSVAPWTLYRLPRPVTRVELLGNVDYSWGIPVDP